MNILKFHVFVKEEAGVDEGHFKVDADRERQHVWSSYRIHIFCYSRLLSRIELMGLNYDEFKLCWCYKLSLLNLNII